MRILLLNQTYSPDTAATAQHAHDLARALVARGHKVHVVTSRSLYGKSSAPLPKEEVSEGVHIHRIGVALFGKKNMLGRMADFVLFFLLSAWKLLRLPKQEVVICLTTPPLIGLVGWFITRLRGGKLISWVMDLYPAVAVAGNVLSEKSLLTRILAALNIFVLKHSARVIVLGRCMQERVLHLGINQNNLALISPWAAEEKSANSPRQDHALPFLNVMYSGNLGLAHDILAFERAMLLLKSNPRVRFIFSGGGKKRAELETFVKENNLIKVSFLPYLPREQLAQHLLDADIHLLSLAPEFCGLVVPSKLYGALAMGRGVAVVAPAQSEVAQVVKEDACGEVFAPNVSGGDALAKWLANLAHDKSEVRMLGIHAHQAHDQKHAPQLRLKQWVDLVENLD